jgi:hypothetical protein
MEVTTPTAAVFLEAGLDEAAAASDGGRRTNGRASSRRVQIRVATRNR